MDLKHKLKDLLMSEFAYDLGKYEDEGEAKVNNVTENLVKLFSLYIVSNWVAISSTEQPEISTEVMVKYKDGRKEVAYFDGDKRFYIEKDDRDITETITEWHKLP